MRHTKDRGSLDRAYGVLCTERARGDVSSYMAWSVGTWEGSTIPDRENHVYLYFFLVECVGLGNWGENHIPVGGVGYDTTPIAQFFT